MIYNLDWVKGILARKCLSQISNIHRRRTVEDLVVFSHRNCCYQLILIRTNAIFNFVLVCFSYLFWNGFVIYYFWIFFFIPSKERWQVLQSGGKKERDRKKSIFL